MLQLESGTLEKIWESFHAGKHLVLFLLRALCDEFLFMTFCSCYFSSNSRKSKDGMKIIAAAFFGVTFGFLIGISFPSLSITKVVSSNPFYLSALCALSFYFFLILGRSSSHMFQVNLPTKFLASNDLSYIEEKGSAIATPDSHKSWSSSKSNDTSSSAPIDKSQACFFYTVYL